MAKPKKYADDFIWFANSRRRLSQVSHLRKQVLKALGKMFSSSGGFRSLLRCCHQLTSRQLSQRLSYLQLPHVWWNTHPYVFTYWQLP
jgi:hypothetical protein